GKVDVRLANLDAVFARVADNLGRRVEAHRLGVEQCRTEDVRIIGLEPGGGVNQEGEGSGMALRETIFAEALELTETALGEVARVALADHALDEFFPIVLDRAGATEGGH